MRNDDEEKLLQKLLQSMMQCVLASFPTTDATFHPPQELGVEDPYASFPGLPIIRKPRNYAADRNRNNNNNNNNNWRREK